MVVPPSSGSTLPSMAAGMSTMRMNMPNGTHSSSFSSRGRMGASTPVTPASSTQQTSNGVTIPLSARKSTGLQLSSVERRGQLNAPLERESKTSRPHGLQDAPTFRPTEEEWKNPIEYIRKIEPDGRKYGIAKIVPPDNWNPPFAIDTERFHFRTRKQELNLAEGGVKANDNVLNSTLIPAGTRANLNYLDQLAKFHKQRHNTTLNRFPSVDKRPLDLYKLKKLVDDKGGFEAVCKGKRWAEIGRDLGYSGKIMSSLSTSLKNSYQKWLQPYEDWVLRNKDGVLQSGSPYTPSPAATPARSMQNTPNAIGNSSPTLRASAALNATLDSRPKTEPPARAGSSGFTPVNPGGGFTAVNAAPPPNSSFAPINGLSRDLDSTRFGQRGESAHSTARTTPESRPAVTTVSGITVAKVANGLSNGLKRQHSSDMDPVNAGESADTMGRRSKRLKQSSAPTVTGSVMIQPRMPASRPCMPRDRSNDKPGDCTACGKGADVGYVLQCDSCDLCYHRHCLDPSFKSASDVCDWHCPRCLVGTGDFGFEEGGIYSLKMFQEKAQAFKEKHFSKKLPIDPKTKVQRPISEEDVEKEFWRLTESLTETVEVEYGADIHSTTHGSGFPTMERNPFDPYAMDPWNLNVLPLEKESLFRYIKSDISGMTVPWLYVGMCFSTFCWHSEDHYTYSANYQHFGDTKTWYGIPSDDADLFETTMREAVPELFEQQPDLLYQLVTLLQPEKLKKAGVRVYALDQHAGEFVITFPQAYHAGFNHGFNFNEAVNFAPSDWEPFGELAFLRLQQVKRQPVFSHDELLFSAAARDGHGIRTAKWLAPALQRTLDRETNARGAFRGEYRAARSQRTAVEDAMDVNGEEPHFCLDPKDLADEETVCCVCKTYAFLSRFKCKAASKLLCLLCAVSVDCCSASRCERLSMANEQHELHLRMADDQLATMVGDVVAVGQTPETWAGKLSSALEDEPKPRLKALKALVSEGEKIDASWPLPELASLKAYVTRCSQLVEEAQMYLMRKPNRRKSEHRSRLLRDATLAAGAADGSGSGSGSGSSSRRERAGAGAGTGTDDAGKRDAPAPPAGIRENPLRNPDNIRKLLDDAAALSFDCPELDKLQERAARIDTFQRNAAAALARPQISAPELDELIDEGKDIDMDIPEMKDLDVRARTVRWFEQAKDHSDRMGHGNSLSLQEVTHFIEQGKALAVADENEYMQYFVSQRRQGEFWESKAQEVMAVENVNFTQLDALSKQASKLPVSAETLAAIDEILKKQREAQDRILSLYNRSKDPNFRKRPRYKEVRETMEALAELNSKPQGTLDLEKEQKRHEDWMRRGKKLFGKANAPLHILLQHMQYVQERNEACLDILDVPRMPVEPASRQQSPDNTENIDDPDTSRDVFCICRKPESGMMIECELCHEWYHGKCLKIARGKVKDDDKYTCPICDYRVKIPRDAARPKLEDLIAWQDEITNLPFQPEEEECLTSIIDRAEAFRRHISSIISPLVSTHEELPVQRFYLRKIEGADVLLADETNFLRQELHKWAPVAPDPPKLIEVSLSTRKPRPTKQQKLMATLGISDPEKLPEHLRPRTTRKKGPDNKSSSSSSKEPKSREATAPVDDQVQSQTPTGLPQAFAVGEQTIINPNLPPHNAYPYGALSNPTTSGYQLESPVFNFAPPSQLEPTSPVEQGIDPQLENMFATSSAVMAERPNDFSATSNNSDLEMFNTLTNGDDSNAGEFVGFGPTTYEGETDREFMGVDAASQ